MSLCFETRWVCWDQSLIDKKQPNTHQSNSSTDPPCGTQLGGLFFGRIQTYPTWGTSYIMIYHDISYLWTFVSTNQQSPQRSFKPSNQKNNKHKSQPKKNKKSKKKHNKNKQQPMTPTFTSTIHIALQTSLSRSPCTLELTTRSEPAKSTKDNKPWQRPWPHASVDGKGIHLIHLPLDPPKKHGKNDGFKF